MYVISGKDRNFCCWATITDGKIISISDETGREGGEIWNSSYKGRGHTPLSLKLAELTYSWGTKWYSKVKRAAYAETLPSVFDMGRTIRTKEITKITVLIRRLEEEQRKVAIRLARLKVELKKASTSKEPNIFKGRRYGGGTQVE